MQASFISEVTATRVLKSLPGDSGAQLVRAADLNLYVLKHGNQRFPNLQVCEALASLIGRSLGLPIPEPSAILIDERLSVELNQSRGSGTSFEWQPGKYVGIRYIPHVQETISERDVCRVANLSDFLGILAFDIWLGNENTRQAIFSHCGDNNLRAHFIDQGDCLFRTRRRDCPEFIALKLYPIKEVYGQDTTLLQFGDWISKIEAFDSSQVLRTLACLPPCWIEDDSQLLQKLSVALDRRTEVAQLINGLLASESSWLRTSKRSFALTKYQPSPSKIGKYPLHNSANHLSTHAT